MRRRNRGFFSAFERHTVFPIELKTVFRLLVVASIVLAGETFAESRLRVGVSPPASGASVVVLVRAKALDAGRVPEVRRIELMDGEGQEVVLPGDSGWAVEAEATGYWSPSLAVVPGQAGSLTLYRTCRVAGKTVVGGPELMARLESRPGDPAPPTKDPLRCEAKPGGLFHCDVPAGRWGFSLRSRGHAPRYEFSQPLTAGGELPVGDVKLVPGASFSGWVTAERREWNAAEAKVYMRPATRLGSLAAARSAPVSSQGFFQLTQVEAGSYQAFVVQPGFSRDVRMVQIAAEMEAGLASPFVLGEPRELALTIEPPVGPDGSPWHVEIRDGLGAAPSFVIGEAIAREGRLRWKELRAGHRYWIWLKTSAGVQWLAEEQGFVADAPVTEKVVRVSVERITGLVLLGGKPLQAGLTFGIDTNVQIQMPSTADGRFIGFLPDLGKWRVQVTAAGERSISKELDVEVVRDATGEGVAEIRLEDMAIQGVLVDEKGALFERSAFVAVWDGKHERDRHRVQGPWFRVGGVGPGEYTLHAEAHGVMSGPQTVKVTKDEEPDQVRLIMKPEKKVAVRVLRPGGSPAVRLPILIVPAEAALFGRGALIRHTDADGRMVFEHLGPEETARCLVVSDPLGGLGSRIERVPVGPDEVTIQLDAISGTIVTVGGSPAVANPSLVHDGCPIWRSHFPMLDPPDFGAFSPGVYALCPGVTWQAGPECVSGTLEPLKTLTLDLRSAQGPEKK